MSDDRSIQHAIAFVIFVTGVATPEPARSAPAASCTRDDSSMRAHFELYPTGQEKLIAAAVKKACGHLDELFQRIQPTMTFGADKKFCTKEKIPTLDTDTTWGKCFGPPYIMLSHDPRDKRGNEWALLPEPSDFEFSNFKVQNGACGEPLIKCSGKTCDVKIPIQHLEVDMDMKMKSIFEKCYAGGLKNVKITANARPNKPVAYIESKFKFGGPDQLASMVQGSATLNIPARTITESSEIMTDDDSPPHHPEPEPPTSPPARPAKAGGISAGRTPAAIGGSTHPAAKSRQGSARQRVARSSTKGRKPTIFKPGNAVVVTKASKEEIELCDWVDPRILQSFKLFLDAKLDDSFDMDQVGSALMQQVLAPIIQENVVGTLNGLDAVAHDLVTPFDVPELGISDPPKPAETLRLKYNAEQWASTLDAIPGMMYFCFDCFLSSVDGPEAAYRGFQQAARKNSDLAFEMNYLDENRLLEFLYGGGDPSKNRLNFCELNGSMANCSQAKKAGGEFDQIEFLAPPTMGWDDQGFYIDAPAVRYTTNHGVLAHVSEKTTINARIHGQLVNNPETAPRAGDSGSTVRFQATSTSLRNIDLSGGDAAGLASRIGQALVDHLPLAHGYVANQVGAAVTDDIPIPDIGLRHIQVFPEAQGITAYGSINDPSKIIPWFDPNTPVLSGGSDVVGQSRLP